MVTLAYPASPLSCGPQGPSQARAGHSRCAPPPRVARGRRRRARFHEPPTLQRIERGDASVSVGIYAAVLHALGLLEGLGQLADPSRDVTGLAMAAERLPQRVRLRRSSEGPDG